MKQTKAMFRSSMLEFHKIENIAICSLLMALSIVLGIYSFYITENLRISFAIIPVAIAGYLYGPAVAAILGGSVDILNYLLKPMGAFFPGFTITNILTGLVYGVFLYKKKKILTRTIVANTIIGLVFNLVLNTAWLYLLYHTPYTVNLITRTPKELIMIGLNSVIIYILINTLKINTLVKKFQR